MKPCFPTTRLVAVLLAGSLGLAQPWRAPPTPRRRPAAAPPWEAPTPTHKIIYALTYTDRIHLEVVGEQNDTGTTQRIDGQGNINLSFIGEVHVAGLSVAQAQDVVAKAYVDGRIYRHPQVTISIEDYASRRVSITGGVKNPGQFELPIEATWSVVELVTKAGGFTDIGKGSDVRIIHANGQKVEHIDVQGVITGRSKRRADDPELMLQPGDSVYVPDKII